MGLLVVLHLCIAKRRRGSDAIVGVRGPRGAWLRTVRFVNVRACDFARLASHSECRFSTKATYKTAYKTIASKLIAKKGFFSALADAAQAHALEYDLAHALEYGLAHETATYDDLFFLV